MNKIIRDPKIANRPVRLSGLSGEAAEAAEEGGAETEPFVGLEEQAEDILIPADAPEEEAQEEDTQAVSEPEAPEPEPEPPPPSAGEIETMVEERVKEFEARFQQEKEDAYRSGFEDGRADGLKEGQAQSQAEIQHFQAMLEALNEQWEDLFRNLDLTLADLAMAVARKMVGNLVERHSEPVTQAVQDCLGYLQDTSRVLIRVNPADLETIRQHRAEWQESIEALENLLVEADPNVSRGGCLVETPMGDLDAQVESRLEKLRTALIEGIRNGAETPPRPSTLPPDAPTPKGAQNDDAQNEAPDEMS